MRAEINLSCGTDLNVPLTVGVYSEPPRGSDKKIIIIISKLSYIYVGLYSYKNQGPNPSVTLLYVDMN